MTKKALVIVENDTEIKEIMKEMDEGIILYKEAENFIHKQIYEKWKQLIGCHWKEIEKILKKRNLLPNDFKSDEDDNKYGLFFDEGVLYLKDKTSDDSESFLNFLFNKK